MNCLLAVVLAAAAPAGAESLLTGVSVGALGGRLAVSGPVRFRAFRLSAPDRFVVDLEDTRLALQGRSWTGAGAIRRLRAAPWSEEPGTTRVVFDLAEPMEGTARESGGAVVVEFRRAPAAPTEPSGEEVPPPDAVGERPDFRDALAPLAVPVPPQAFSRPAPAAAPARLLSVEAGSDRVILRLDRPAQADIFMAAAPPRLVIDLPGVLHAAGRASLPPGGGVVRGARSSAFRGGDAPAARVVLDLERPAPYSVERRGAELSVSFERSATAPRAASRTRDWRGWIVDAAGRPLSGVFLVRFSLPEAGGGGARWTESLYVDASGGRFSAVLGRFSALPTDALAPGAPLDAAAPSGVSYRVVPR